MGNLVLPAGSNINHVIGESLLFASGDGAYLSKVVGSGHRTKWTFSCWVKRGKISGVNQYLFSSGTGSTQFAGIVFKTDNRLEVIEWNTTAVMQYTTTALFRDTSAWMHVHVIYDSNQAVDSDRVKISVDGVLITDFAVETKPSLGLETHINDAITHQIGGTPVAARIYDGYMAEVAFLGGRAYSVDYFGETHPDCDAIWRPISIAGLDYSGVNSFHLDFADNSSVTALGYDVSGNAFHYNQVNFATTDQTIDSPTNNYCTFDHSDPNVDANLSQGNLTAAITVSSVVGAFGVFEGKWAWQITASENGTFGVKNVVGTITSGADISGEVVEFELNMDALTLYKRVDGGNLEYVGALNSYIYMPYASDGCVADFGQRGFTPTDPDFKTLCSQNITDIPIKDPKDYFEPVLYTGDASTGREIVTQNKVDHVVIKSRSTAYSWITTDSERGVDKQLSWDNNAAETALSNAITGLGAASGFTIGANTTVNDNFTAFLALPFTKHAVAGMDIISYTGTGVARTVSHNLGVIPELMIVKVQSIIENWAVYFKSIGATKFLQLDTNLIATTSSTRWNNTPPSSTEFTVNTSAEVNSSGEGYISYLFASVKGFSQVFSYLGNGNADGPLVHCGFKPAFIMIKRTSAVGDWTLHTIPPNEYNPTVLHLIPSLATAESTATRYIDFLSNGFKIRHTNELHNINGSNYVGIAFAEYPFALLNNAEL